MEEDEEEEEVGEDEKEEARELRYSTNTIQAHSRHVGRLCTKLEGTRMGRY